jgi:L-malate glycosyltransferase
MNLLFISYHSSYFSKSFGGAETSMRLLATELAKRGHSVYYFTIYTDYPSFYFIRKDNIDGVNIYNLSFLYFFKKIPFVSRVFSYFFLNNLVKKKNIDVVYCFYELEIISMLLNFKKEGFDFKIIMRMAGLRWYEDCLKNKDLVGVYDRIFNEVDAINFNHVDLRRMNYKRMEELNMRREFNNEIIGDIGIDLIKLRRKKIDKKDNFNMIMASRFSNYQKRQDILIEAMNLVKKEMPIKLILIGSGIQRKMMEKRIRELGLSDRVLIKSFLSQEELWEKLRCADLMCHACDYEGLSKVISESMAIGLPVLVSNVGSLNKYIIDGKNGFLVDNNPKKWAEKIEWIYSNQEALKDISKNAIKYAEDNYNPEKNILIYEKESIRLLKN